MELIDQKLMKTIAGISDIQPGAFSLRKNGKSVERKSSGNIMILPKQDKPGIDIMIRPGTAGETVYIPVILTESGVNDMVYNDFYISDGCDVTIVAGCGIYNDGHSDSRHDGIHTFHVGRNARVKYTEKHYGEGSGAKRILNPATIVNMEEGSSCEMELVQIKGVDSSNRTTTGTLGKNAKLVITERLLTHGDQTVRSDVKINLEGNGSSLQIVSRSVARDSSVQVFHPCAEGNGDCRAHVQCDSIIMDNAKISSIPEIAANNENAQLIHEAAIGRIHSDELIKLQTFGLSETEAEAVIIDGFLK
ncbi:MAG: SufB/SufD family protein [Christensenellales bacterium]